MQTTTQYRANELNDRTIFERIRVNESIYSSMKTLSNVTTFVAVLLAAPMGTTAALIDFSGIDLASVSSAAGQDFSYTVGSGGATGSVNVRKIIGTPSSVQIGYTPDAYGFYALQSGDDLSPMIFRFTFDASRSFTITQNEEQAAIEVNSFTVSSGAWTLLSASYTTPTSSGSNIMFVAANGAPPYGDYAIAGTGSSFDFQITNSPGYPVYGSAISVNVVSDVPVGPELGINLAVRLRWQSQSDKSYQPQYSVDPSTNTWSNLGSALPGTGQVMELFDSTEAGPKKFYRLQVL